MAKRRAKKKDAHHGGAWKVAFADFMTAMMALFLVLWISSQEKKILIATARYFQNPFSSPIDRTSGVMPYDTNKPSKPHGDDSGADEPQTSKRDIDLNYLNSLAKDMFKMLNLDQDLSEKSIDIQVTSDGLRIMLYDRARKPLFVESTAEFTEWGKFVMQSLAWMIDRQKFRVVIEGHTRKGVVMPKAEYGAWELSADRANAARRLLTFYAVEESRIERVTGYADTRPLPFQSPESEVNQRVTLSLTVGTRQREQKEPDLKATPASNSPKSPAGPTSPATAAQLSTAEPK
ncbi:MAG: flagellar motor protein MotB [Nibricoccus sp.]